MLGKTSLLAFVSVATIAVACGGGSADDNGFGTSSGSSGAASSSSSGRERLGRLRQQRHRRRQRREAGRRVQEDGHHLRRRQFGLDERGARQPRPQLPQVHRRAQRLQDEGRRPARLPRRRDDERYGQGKGRLLEDEGRRRSRQHDLPPRPRSPVARTRRRHRRRLLRMPRPRRHQGLEQRAPARERAPRRHHAHRRRNEHERLHLVPARRLTPRVRHHHRRRRRRLGERRPAGSADDRVSEAVRHREEGPRPLGGRRHRRTGTAGVRVELRAGAVRLARRRVHQGCRQERRVLVDLRGRSHGGAQGRSPIRSTRPARTSPLAP